jgi:hypothetical protein
MRHHLNQHSEFKMTTTRNPLWAALIAALASTVLAGCATTDCSRDWYAVGQRDGSLGALPQYEYYSARCAAPVDRTQYMSGWEDGFARRPLPNW